MAPAQDLAHDNLNVSCQVCHSSWATACFGCHLPMRANQRVAGNKFEGLITRNYTPYNPQVVRDDVFQLGIDATYKNNRLAVLRSSSAVVVGSQNGQREWVYSQQQTVSAEGYSGQAYNPHFPHTTSGAGTTKNCTDCHLSKNNDNNAWMTSLLGFGTGTVNFFGRYRLRWRRARTDSKPSCGPSVMNRRRRSAVICTSWRIPINFAKHDGKQCAVERGVSSSREGDSRSHAARRISLHRQWRRRVRGLRRGEHRQQRFQRTHHQHAGFSARPTHAHPHQVCDERDLAEHAGH